MPVQHLEGKGLGDCAAEIGSGIIDKRQVSVKAETTIAAGRSAHNNPYSL